MAATTKDTAKRGGGMQAELEHLRAQIAALKPAPSEPAGPRTIGHAVPVVFKETVYTTVDRLRVVPEGSADAAFLLGRAGAVMHIDQGLLEWAQKQGVRVESYHG